MTNQQQYNFFKKCASGGLDPTETIKNMPPPAKGKRQTSHEAAKKLKMPKSRLVVYECLKKHKGFPLSSCDLSGKDFVNKSVLSIRPRLTELEQAGLIKAVGRRKNKWGNNEITWEIADETN